MGTSDKKKLVAGILAGAAAGTTAAVLLTPKSGKETRTEILDKVRKTTNDTEQAIKSGKNKAKSQFRKTQKKVADTANKVNAKTRSKF